MDRAGDGVYFYDENESDSIVFKHFLSDERVINQAGLNLGDVQCILQDKYGNIWFGSGPFSGEGLCCYNGKSLVNYKPGGETWIRYIKEDEYGNLWVGTRHQGIWFYDKKTFTRFMEGSDIGLSALVDRSGNVWFSGGEEANGYSSDGSVWLYDGTSLTRMAENSFGSYGVWTMLEDKNGNIWFGTRHVGLYRYNGKEFTKFSE